MFLRAPKTPTVDPPRRGTIARAEWDIQLLAAGVRAIHRDLRLLAVLVTGAIAADWFGVDAAAFLATLAR